MIRRRTCLSALTSNALLLACNMPARAQQFPAKPIRLVVGFAPGGTTDLLARLLAQQITTRTGVAVTVENKPGASGTLAMDHVARAQADGYTLLWGSDSVVVQPLLRRNMTFDPFRDLQPLARLGTAPFVMGVGKAVAARDLKDLVNLAKAKPGGLRYGSSGTGSTGHLAGETFKRRADIAMVHVPYKGTAPALTDAIGGHIEVVMAGVAEVMPYVVSGDLRALGVISESRVPGLPQVPTFAESGYPGYFGASWMGVLAPAGLPSAVAAWLTDQILLAAQTDDFKQKAQSYGIVGGPLKGAETTEFMRSVSARARDIINTAGITLD